MHIYILNLAVEYYSPVCGGAISTVVMETAKEFIARGHDVSVLTIVNDDPTYKVGRVIPVEARSRDSLSFVQRRWSDFRQRMGQWDWPYYEYFMKSYTQAMGKLSPKPDVVIVHNDLAAPRFIKKVLPKTPVICWLHNENRTRALNLEANQSAVAHYITVSDYIRKWTIQNHGIDQKKVTTILNGVNLETFHARAESQGQSRKSGDEVKVLFASRIDRNKGPDLAANAVAALRAEGHKVSLTVAGAVWWYNHAEDAKDPFFQELRGKMDRAGAQYLGHVTREGIPALFRDHDIVCLLSRSHDPCPLVCLEALASGCALLGSTRGGIPELCGDAALLVNPDDQAAVTDALRKLVSNPGVLQHFQAAGLNRAAARPWAKVAQEAESVIRRATQLVAEPALLVPATA